MNNSGNQYPRPKCATAADFYKVASNQRCKLRMRDFTCDRYLKEERKEIPLLQHGCQVTEENLIKLQSSLIKQQILVQPEEISDSNSFGNDNEGISRVDRSLCTRKKMGRPFSTEMNVRIVCYRDIDTMYQHLVKNDSSVGYEIQEMTFGGRRKFSQSNLSEEICSTFGLSEWAFVRVIRRVRNGRLQPVLLRGVTPPIDCPVEFVKREIALPRYKSRMKIFIVGCCTNEVRFCEEYDENVRVLGSRFSLEEPTYSLNEEIQTTPEQSWSPSCSPCLPSTPSSGDDCLPCDSPAPGSLDQISPLTPRSFDTMHLPRTPPALVESISPCRTPRTTSPAEAQHKLLSEVLSIPTDSKVEYSKVCDNTLEFGGFLIERKLPALNPVAKEELISGDNRIRLPGISSIFASDHINIMK